MKLFVKPSFFFFFGLLVIISCRKSYNPPAIQAGNHFLAVDGFINTGANASSTFIVSRSLNLRNTIPIFLN